MKSQLFFPFCLVLFSHGPTVDPQELSATQVRQLTYFTPFSVLLANFAER